MNVSPAARLCLALSEIHGFGLKAFHTLQVYSPDICRWPELDRSELRMLFSNASLADSVASVLGQDKLGLPEKVEAWLEDASSVLLSYFDDAYPEILRQIHLAPPLLYVQGNIDLLSSRGLAIVGSRKTSPMYQRLAEQYAFELARHHWTVTSGLALGVDAAAHMGALAAQGNTIAVVATGLDRCYPERNRALRDRILEQGLIVSEMPLGSPPLKQHFPRRNRIVSGLSRGVLVVEAGIKSGSLITARYALEQNREVFAIPGSPLNKGSEGCNFLIREGARLVTSTKDLMEDLQLIWEDCAVTASEEYVIDVPPDAELSARSKEEKALLSYLSDQIMSFDELFAASDLSFESVSQHLLNLELGGVIAQVAGGYQRVS